MVKLLPYNLEITGSNHENNILQSKVKLYTIDPFPGLCIGGSFVYWVVFFSYPGEIILELSLSKLIV